MPLLAPLGPGAVHLVIDMQRLFAEATDWHTPGLSAVLPNVVRIATAHPDDSYFARFTVPPTPAAAAGRWRHYYEHWRGVTGEAIAPELIDLVAPLAALATPERVFDKPTYSVMKEPALRAAFARRGVDTVVFTGVETDVCVLASLLDAVDMGLHAVVVADALASGSDAAHRAVIDTLLPRLDRQVDVVSTDELLAAWPGPRP